MGKRGTSIMVLTPKQRFIAGKMEKELNVRFVEKVLRGGALSDAGGFGGGPAADAAKTARHAAAKTAAKPDARAAAPKKAAPNGKKAERPSDRHRDKKNKGAPRWLKEKREQGKEGEGEHTAPRKP